MQERVLHCNNRRTRKHHLGSQGLESEAREENRTIKWVNAEIEENAFDKSDQYYSAKLDKLMEEYYETGYKDA